MLSRLDYDTKKMKSSRNCFAFHGIAALILGITVLILKPWFLKLILESVLIIKPNSTIVDLWLKMPVQIPTDIYFFNWTNPEDFRNFSIKPKFEQVGPYRFMQEMEKIDVVWNANDTVTYKQVRTWHFNEEQTNGSLDDIVTSLNFVTTCMVHYIRNWNYFVKKGISLLLTTKSPDINLTTTVNEYLVEGFDNPFVDLTHYVPFVEPDLPRVDKLGWIRIRNHSSTFDGILNKGIGVNGDFDIHNWNYYNVTPYFDSSCAQVQGSDGELNSYKTSKDYFDIFVPEICRYVRLDFEEEVIVKGILGHKYSVGKTLLDNGTNIPENKCFCSGDCVPSGMLNVSSCRYGVPAFVSLPHFYKADPVYLDAVEGLHPKKTKHEAFVVIEPTTFVLLQVASRAQLNFWVHPVEDITIYEDVPKLFFPHLWADQSYTIEGYIEFLLKFFLNGHFVFEAVSLVFSITGLCLVCMAYKPTLVFLYKKVRQKNNPETPKPEEVPLQT